MHLVQLVFLFVTLLSIYIIPTLASPSSKPSRSTSLSLRSLSTVGNIYWDQKPSSTIRVIFNLALTNAITQALLNSNIDITQAVITTFRSHVATRDLPWLSGLLETASIYGQLGQHWRDVVRKPDGVLTISFTVVLKEGGGALARYGVVNELRYWLSQGGNSAMVRRVADASMVGGQAVVGKRDTVKRDGSNSARPDMPRTNFCQTGAEEWSWKFAGGAADVLAEERAYCWSAPNRENLMLRYGSNFRS
ncbi:MAG: hypothetical protein M1812_004441 [Candelaria pacifica]|nr:MAG: hypothetical protein M1812_004441 [Candelaria pacifica]